MVTRNGPTRLQAPNRPVSSHMPFFSRNSKTTPEPKATHQAEAKALWGPRSDLWGPTPHHRVHRRPPRRSLWRRASGAIPAGSWAAPVARRHYTPVVGSSSFHPREFYVFTVRGLPSGHASRVSVAQGGPRHVSCTRPYGPSRAQRFIGRRRGGSIHRTR